MGAIFYKVKFDFKLQSGNYDYWVLQEETSVETNKTNIVLNLFNYYE